MTPEAREYIEEAVADAPPLNPEQVNELAELFSAAVEGATDD